MSLRFAQIFWGLLLTILDFKFNGLDILPDFLGYILIALGCRGLAEFSDSFLLAGRLGWIMVAFPFVGYALRGNLWIVTKILNRAIDTGMIWFLLGGVMELAVASRRPLFRKAHPLVAGPTSR